MHYKLCMCGFSQHRRHTRATPGRCWCGLGRRRGRAACGQTRLWRLQHVTRALCGWAPPWAPRPHCPRQQVTWPQMFLQSSPWFHCPQTTASSSLRTTPGWLSPALSWVPSPRRRLRPRCVAGTPPHLDFLLLVTSSPTTLPPSFASNKDKHYNKRPWILEDETGNINIRDKLCFILFADAKKQWHDWCSSWFLVQWHSPLSTCGRRHTPPRCNILNLEV